MSASEPSLLIVDDDDTLRNLLARELGAAGLTVAAVSRGEEVENALVARAFDVVLLDLKMTGMNGLTTLECIKQVRPLTEVIILTGHGSMESAVQALKLGAYDFLTKPCDLDHLESTIRRAAETGAIRSENAALRQDLSRRADGMEIIGKSPAIEKVKALIDKVAPTDSTVLIRGESGSGKEVVARTIHRLSQRRARPLVILDCGATEESLALSKLFGHERGAFTGATKRTHGLFELADHGTILIDEVGDASPTLQTRLLRALETGTFCPLGGEESIRVNVRILAATHRDLEARIREGTFREDLFYRLNVLTIEVPPLRERSDDIEELVGHFLKQLRPGAVPVVASEALDLMRGYHWPGNVRELRNALERAVILADDDVIRTDDLPIGRTARPLPWKTLPPESSPPSLRDVERQYLELLLERYGGHRGRVAEALGISERTLYRRLHSLMGDRHRAK